MVSREHTPQRRLPPKVLSRKKKGKKGSKLSKRRKKPWYRHIPWMISLVACGVFIVLIGGVFGVRQVVILVRGSHSEVTAEDNGSPAGSAGQKGSTDLELNASLKSNEPRMEVLPPKAAMQPGRKLPKMLLVGRRSEMFQSLEKAMKIAIPGDIIEIRTSRPMLVRGSELRADFDSC